MVFGFFSQNWNPDGKHCYVTGGSQGLGLAFAKILVTKGAHVSIVARNQQKLDAALAELEAVRIAPSQILQAHSASLVSASESTAALEAVCKAHDGQAPDAVITCAGSAKPGFFVETTEQDLLEGMQNGYWVQAWTAWAALKMMVKQKKRGCKICLVSSMLGYMSIIGWSPYAPPKTALRALADTLQSETMLYDIETQIYFPPTMFSPGLENENKTKPDIVKKIDESDDGQTPEQAALQFYKGFVRGDAHITGDLLNDLFRAGTRGVTPRANFVLDVLYDLAQFVAAPVWRRKVDRMVRAHGPEHQRYLQERGFFG